MPLRTVLRIARLGVTAIFLTLLGTRPLLADANGAWRGMPPAPGRTQHVSVYDAANDRLIVVLGLYYEDTLPFLFERDIWTRSFTPFGGWHQMLPTGSGPSGPVSGRMVHDSTRDHFVMASGSTLTTLDLAGGGTWTTATIAGTPPSSRSSTSAVYDPGGDRIVYFAGNGDSYFNEVWSVNLSGTPTWVQITPAGTPPQARASASAVYDVAGQRMIVFGGQGATSFQDVWALSLVGTPAWAEITPAVPGPDARSDAAVEIDPARNRMLVQGGRGTNDTTLWALDLGATQTWSAVTTTGAGPGKRWNHTMSYDGLRDRMLVYGGAQEASYPSGQLLALDLASGTWSEVSETHPAPRHDHTAVYDAPRQRMIVFGGGPFSGPGDGETWSLSLSGAPAWTQLSPSGSTPPFEGHTAIVDPVRQRMIAFAAYPTGDVWSFDLAGSPAWTHLSTAGTPPGFRTLHVAIYDPNGDRMIVFGGDNSLTDVWQLTLSGTPTWTQLFPTGTAPPGLIRPAAIYDPVGARMLILGSGTAGGFAAKLWSLSLTGSPTWQLLTTTGSGPQDCGGSSAVYDGARQRMLVFSGGYGCNSNSTSTWALSLSGPLQWSLLSPAGIRMVLRCDPSAIYDSAGDRMVIYGGQLCSGIGQNVDMDSAWSLEFGTTTSTPVAALPADVQLFPAIPNPSSGDVTLEFALPRAASARLAIYDLAGRKIAEPFSGALTAGRHEVRWTRAARDAAGLEPGVYFSELRVGNQRAARRMVVTR